MGRSKFPVVRSEAAKSQANLYAQVYQGTQNAGKEFKEAKLWDDANKWLADRR